MADIIIVIVLSHLQVSIARQDVGQCSPGLLLGVELQLHAKSSLLY